MVAWGNAQTIASLVIAMLMPILGALADYAGNKIKFFLGFFLTGLVLCLAQGYPHVRHGIFDRVRAVHHRP